MSLLLRIVRAAHATGTHHKIALDALPRLAGPLTEGWSRAFLVDAARLLAGAKAPDDEFKDFANHVLHPADGYWGGAPEKVVEWYDKVVAALRAGGPGEAAFAAGVLSHYLSDPFMPLHTGQSEAEDNYHRAIEWSISRSYDRLVAAAPAPLAVDLGAGARGLKDLVCRSAERANRHYEALLAHYDLAAGVIDPPSGLDLRAQAIAAEMLVAAREAFAAVLSRAIVEAGTEAPEVSLAGPTLKAVLAIPRKLLDKRLADAGDRAVVLAQYDELRATGRVDATLDEDQRTVRDAFAAEVAPPRDAARQAARERRLASGAGPAVAPEAPAANRESLRERLERQAALDELARFAPRPAQHLEALPEPLESRIPAAGALNDAVAFSAAVAASAAASVTASEPLTRLSSLTARPPKPPRIHLATTDRIEAAPSIGPRMAERLGAAGLVTVADLLAADAELIAQSGIARVDAQTLRDWQDQARLVLTIPGLRGGGAQLLTGAGYRTLEAIAAADPGKLCADVLAFAATPAGNRILRDGQPPDVEKVKAWADAAREVAKAA